MKPAKLSLHLNKCHPLLANKPKEYFEALRESDRSSSLKLKRFLIERNSASGLTASYNIALLIAKQGRPHTIAEDLIKPAIMEAYKVANISNPESVLNNIPLSNNTISSRISDMADDVKSILVQDLQHCKFSLTVDESTFANQSVLLAFVRYIKDSRLREELLFMKTLINTTGEQVYNAVTDFLKTNDISMDNIISICTDGAPSMIGKRKGFVSRLIQDRNVFTIHCVLHRENLVAKNIGDRDFIAILQTVVSSVNKIRTRALQDRLFQDACRDESFHRLVYSTDVRWLSMGNCLTRFVLLFDKVLEFLKDRDIVLSNSLRDNKVIILYLEEIFRKLNELNISLQSQDMNIVCAKQIIKAFMNKLVIWKMTVVRHNFSHFASLEGKEIDSELQRMIVDHLSFLHDNFQTRFEDLLSLNVPPFVNLLHTMTMEDVMDQPECFQIELCEAIADDHMIQASEKNWVKAWLQSSTKYQILYETVEPFIINLPTSNLAEKGFSFLLHSFSKQRSSLHLNDNSEMRLRLSNLQPRIATLVSHKQAQGSH